MFFQNIREMLIPKVWCCVPIISTPHLILVKSTNNATTHVSISFFFHLSYSTHTFYFFDLHIHKRSLHIYLFLDRSHGIKALRVGVLSIFSITNIQEWRICVSSTAFFLNDVPYLTVFCFLHIFLPLLCSCVIFTLCGLNFLDLPHAMIVLCICVCDHVIHTLLCS